MVHNPCQSFSTAGHRGSINDPRGRIFLDFVRIVDQTGPRLFVMENVRGLKSAALQHRPLNEHGDCYPQLFDVEELGSMLCMGILPVFIKSDSGISHFHTSSPKASTPDLDTASGTHFFGAPLPRLDCRDFDGPVLRGKRI